MALRDQTVQVLDMNPRRNFRHHAAIGRVVLNLRKHDITDDFPAAIGKPADNGGRRFITGGFNTEDMDGCCGHGNG